MMVALILEERDEREEEVPDVHTGAEGSRSCWPGCAAIATVREICREYEIAETLYYQWRDRLLEGGKAALATPRDKGGDPRDAENRELRKKVANLERALGRKTYEVEVAGELLRDWT